MNRQARDIIANAQLKRMDIIGSDRLISVGGDGSLFKELFGKTNGIMVELAKCKGFGFSDFTDVCDKVLKLKKKHLRNKSCEDPRYAFINFLKGFRERVTGSNGWLRNLVESFIEWESKDPIRRFDFSKVSLSGNDVAGGSNYKRWAFEFTGCDALYGHYVPVFDKIDGHTALKVYYNVNWVRTRFDTKLGNVRYASCLYIANSYYLYKKKGGDYYIIAKEPGGLDDLKREWDQHLDEGIQMFKDAFFLLRTETQADKKRLYKSCKDYNGFLQDIKPIFKKYVDNKTKKGEILKTEDKAKVRFSRICSSLIYRQPTEQDIINMCGKKILSEDDLKRLYPNLNVGTLTNAINNCVWSGR